MLIEKIFEQARSTPHKAAYLYNGSACSYAGFARSIADALEQLASCGLPAGSVAVLLVNHLAQAWVLGIALRRLGLVTVNLDRAEQIAGFDLKNVSCLVTVGADLQGRGAAVADGSLRRVVVAWAEPAEAADLTVPALPAAPHAEAGHLLLTSGTTGASKKLLRDAATEYSTIDLHAQINQVTADSVVYVRDFPLWTAGGYRWSLMTWSQGATVVLQQGRDFDRVYQMPGLTHAFATPATLDFVLNPGADAVRRNDGMRLLVTGGAMSRTLASAVLDRLTTQVFVVLASSEALTLAVTPLHDLDDLRWHRIHPRREVQVVDEQGQALAPGQVGLVRARLLDGLAAYVDDEAATQTFFRDGYFYSGDLGLFGPDGRLALCGRVTDVLNVMGNKLAPEPIERDLQDRLDAAGVCVLSLPGPGGDEEVHVLIEPRRKITPAELERCAHGPLNGLGRVHFRFVAALPRNTMGKVERLVVRRQLERGGGDAGDGAASQD